MVPRLSGRVNFGKRLVALALAAILAAPLGADGAKAGGEPLETRVETPALAGSGDTLPTADPRVIPEPIERELVPEPQSEAGKRALSGVSLFGVGAGLALSAVGISLFFSAAGDGLDSPAMHRGLTVAVSGSLVAAIFSALRNPRPSGFEAR